MKKIIICYFASVTSLIGFFGALSFNLIPLALLLGTAFVMCLLWFSDIAKQHNDRLRRRAERHEAVTEYYSIDIPLDMPEDKPGDKSSQSGTVRPGSRPSVTYRQMIALQKGADPIDLRAEA